MSDPRTVKVEKNISQMRGIFAFFGIINLLVMVGTLISLETEMMFLVGLPSLVISLIFPTAFRRLGQRSK